MALLNFKYGLMNKIKDLEVNPGTVYITKDERAMYVDIPDDSAPGRASRIRIGDFRIFTYYDEMVRKIKEDASELTITALYYVEKNRKYDENTFEPILNNGESQDVIDVNGLYRYTGENNLNPFIRLNEVSDFSGELTSLNTRVGSLETAINDENGTVATKIGVETQARTEADAKHTEDIAKNAQAISANAGSINTHSEKISNIEGQIVSINTQLNTNIPDTYLTKTDASATYLTKTDASTTYATKTDLSDAETRLVGNSGDDSSKNTIWAAKNMASAASASATSANTLAGQANTTANNNSGEISTIKERLDAVEDIADNAATKTELAQEVSDREAAIAGVNAITTGLNTRLEQVEVYFETDGRGDEVINTFNEIVELITSDETGSAALLARVNQNAEDIEGLDTRLTALDGTSGKIATIEGQITSLNTNVGKAEENANDYTESLLTWGTF